MSKGVDLVVMDTAHGHSGKVLRSIRELRETFPELEIIGEILPLPLVAR